MLNEILSHGASRLPQKPALIEAGRTLTYRQLLDAQEVLAQRLRESGLAPGRTVATQMVNSMESAVAVFAVASIGATNLVLDPALKAEEVGRCCRQAGAAAILCLPSVPRNAFPQGLTPLPVPPLDDLRGHEPARAPSLPRRTASIPDSWNLFLLLSSGTAGSPKIVPKTRAQAYAALRVFSNTIPYSETDRVLAVLPWFHSFGLFNVLLASFAAGSTLYVERFSPRETAAAIERHRITVLPATPFMFRMLAETDFRVRPDFSSVRIAISAGSALPPAVARRVREKLAIDMTHSYGTTETGPITIASPEVYVENPGWAGAPYSEVVVEIRDSSGTALRQGVDGEIAVKSPANASRYLGEPEAGAASFQGDWILTGDIGHLDERGDLFVLGRKRRMVNVAGKKVAPAEVEACLRSHPSVADVLVLADKAPEGGERVKALVVPAAEADARELQAFCAARLADFKVPRQIVLVKSLPPAPMGEGIREEGRPLCQG